MTPSATCCASALVIACANVLAAPARAGGDTLPEPIIEVSAEDGRYSIRFELETALPLATIHTLVTDYRHLHQINPSIRESRLVAAPRPNEKYVYTRVEGCVVVFCSELGRLERVHEPSYGVIESEIVPEQSDFRRGTARWRLESIASGTRIRYDADFEPKQKLLPWLGPWMVRRVLREQLLTSAARLRGQSYGRD
ncbi:MAG: SRPBCC family protein [Thiotrichales bacterium]